MRLGIYVDDVYRITSESDERAPSVDRTFPLFACEVGLRLGRPTVFGRTLSAGPPAEHVLPSGVELIPLPYYSNLRSLPEVLAAARKTCTSMWRGLSRIDCVWVFGPHPFALLLVCLATLRNKGVVLGVRQQTLPYFRQRLPNARWLPAMIGIWVMDRLYRQLARRFPTTVVGDEIAAGYRSSRSNIATITPSLISSQDLSDGSRKRSQAETITLLAVGRLEPEKDPATLVEALAELDRLFPSRYRLIWAGRGRMEPTVRRSARALGIADLVDLRGYVPFGPTLLDLYRQAHVYVHVAATEGVPQALVEALGMGIPVVTSDVGGVRALLQGGAAGLLVPPSDPMALASAIARISADGKLREDMCARGSAIARSLTVEVQSERAARFITTHVASTRISRAGS